MDQAKAISESTRKASYRWAILIIISLVIFSNYYVFRALAPIKIVLQSQFGFSNEDYGMMISFYSITNIFMCVIGGIILDRWGIRKTGLMFFTISVIGILVAAFGTSELFYGGGVAFDFMGSFVPGWSPEFKMILLGRLLFGLGSETSLVVINAVLVRWFKGKELALAFGLNLAIARLGDATAFLISDNFIQSTTNVGNALWAAFLIMSVGFVLWVVYTFMDKGATIDKNVEVPEEDKFKFNDLILLVKNRSFIYITLLCVIFYSAVFPFLDFSADFLFNKFEVSLEMANTLASLIVFGTIVFTPIFGWIVDKYGKRASLMMLGSGLLILVHLVFGLTSLTPYIPLFLLGISFSLVPAAMWPAVPFIVPEKRIGTAYGMMFAIQNIGLFVFPYLAGWILDLTNPDVVAKNVALGLESYDYTYTMLMFAVLGGIGFIFAMLLKRQSTVSNINLEKGSKNE